MTIQQIDRAAFAQDWQAWHEERERILADPHGFLAVTGLHWLTADPQRIPRAPGRWSTSAEGALVELDPGEEITLEGTAITGEHRFAPLPERGGLTFPWEQGVIEVARRGGRDIVRPRHPDHPLRTGFREVPTYPPNPRWALPGHFVPYLEPRDVTVDAAVEEIEHVYQSPGEITFEVRGERFSLVAFNGKQPDSLLVLFTDATSGLTTYAACRALHLDPPDADGSLIVDFNRAANLPCAFTTLATCPLPPPANRLPIGVEAGEKTPHERL